MRHGIPRAGLAVVIALATAVFAVAPLDAQRRGRNRQPQPSARLQAVTALDCRFPTSARGGWDADKVAASIDERAVAAIKFTHINVGEGTAEVSGLGQPAEVTARLVGNNLHLLDIRTNGDLAVTTVFPDETTEGRLKAVQSRSQYNTAAGGTTGPAATQFYGDCAAS